MSDGIEPLGREAPPALATLRARRLVHDPRRALRTQARVALLLAGFLALALGQPIVTVFCFFAWAGVGHMRIGGPRYPAVARRGASPREAALLALRPEHGFRRLDAHTYCTDPNDDTELLEIWTEIQDPALADAWFDLALGPEPRITGHADRVGPLLDLHVAAGSEGEHVLLRAQWLGWVVRPEQRGLDPLVTRARALRDALAEGTPPTAAEVGTLAESRPFLAALAMLAAPEAFEGSVISRRVRPSLRWLARDTNIRREARARAARLFAPVAESPEDALALLDTLGVADAEGPPAARAAEHLGIDSPHVQIAAAGLLARVGTPAHCGALLSATTADRGMRAELTAAIQRALVAIEARHGPAAKGSLAVIDGDGSGAVSLADDDEA